MRSAPSLGSLVLSLIAFAAALPATPHGAPVADRRLVAIAPARDDARGVTVYLHGLCGGPWRGCGALRDAATSQGWLLCPTAPGDCAWGGPSWSAPPRARDATLSRALRAAGPADGARVLVGFSQGAFTALDIARRSPGRWSALALIGADVRVDASALRRAGVRRVLLAAGRFDGASRAMRATAARLAGEGFDARFLSLGDVGHTPSAHPASAGWYEPLAWLHGAR